MILKTIEEIDKIRKASRIVSGYLSLIIELINTKEISTLELDQLAEIYAKDHGARPAFKGYKGFPYSICASLNDEVVHGMPSEDPLQEGDVISIDYGILLNGYHGDSAITLGVGDVGTDARNQIKNCQECLYQGILAAKVGNRISHISGAIQKHAEDYGYEPVRDFVGHGVGKNLHEPPQIPNYTLRPVDGIRLKSGMVLAIEPMTVAGEYFVNTEDNGWTVTTEDKSLAVHWEHTIVLTKEGPEILTLREGEEDDL